MKMLIDIVGPSIQRSLTWGEGVSELVFGRLQSAEVVGHLPDPQQLISRKHFTLSRASGSGVLLTVVSQASSVTMTTPHGEVGCGQTAELSLGDSIRLADYTITLRSDASLLDVASAGTDEKGWLSSMSSETSAHNFGAFFGPHASDVGGSPSPSGLFPTHDAGWESFPQPVKEVSAPDIASVPDIPVFKGAPPPPDGVNVQLPPGWADWMSQGPGVQYTTPNESDSMPAPPVVVAPATLNSTARSGAPQGADGRPTAASEAGGLSALFKGMGIEADLSKVIDEAAMERLGRGFRHLIEGLTALMDARSEFKHDLRAHGRTMLVERNNNPFKRHLSVQEVFNQLIARSETTDAYLPMDLAVQEAIEDLQAHEFALVAASRAAIEGILQDFDPGRLRPVLAGGKSKLPQFLDNARLWDAYVVHYEKRVQFTADWVEQSFNRHFMPTYSRVADREGPRGQASQKNVGHS